MSIETLTALIGFAFVMAISPGPGNFLLLASGANFGYMRTVPMIIGICGGFIVMLIVVGFGLGQILQANPTVGLALRLVCIGYVLWLAWKIARVRSIDANALDIDAKPFGLIQAAVLQFVNPKAWAVALIATVSYTNAESYAVSLMIVIVTFAVVVPPSNSVWVLSGTAIRRLLATDRKVHAFNITMAILLVGSMVPVILDFV